MNQDLTKNAREKEFLDDLINIAIELQRDEKKTIIGAFNEGQKHGFDKTIPIEAGAIYYNRTFKNQHKK